jgi:glutamate carboxypeptidase
VLLLGHVDTVWPVGSWSEPWRRQDDRVSGPGVYDMKGGVLFIVWLLDALQAGGVPHPTLEVLLTPDEEAGSVASRPHLVEASGRADAALVLEPATPQGDIKSGRRGAGEFVIRIRGRAAHQGVDPQAGVNAVAEAAHQVLHLLELDDPVHGTTVGPNVLRGGTACNVVAESAEIRVDVRTWDLAEMERIDRAVRGLEPHLPGARVEVGGGWNRPPMSETGASAELVRLTVDAAARVGLALRAVSWPGASDANIVAAHGVPALDGLGPAGDGAHQPREHVLTGDLDRRMAMLYELVTSLREFSRSG